MTLESIIYREIWGDEDFHLFIDGQDVTYVRGVPVQIGGYQLTEPFSYGPADFLFPQIGPDEIRTNNTGALSWLNDERNAKLCRMKNGQIYRTVWRGVVTRRSANSGGVTIHCDGDLSGRLALADVQPSLRWMRRDIGSLVAWKIAGVKVPFRPAGGPNTGIKVATQDGDSDRLSYVTELLALAQELSGTQWTVSTITDQARGYRMHRKDRDTIHYTVFLKAHGVELDVADDLAEKPNRVYGRGEVKGDKWLNVKRPNVRERHDPPFPGLLKRGDDGPDVRRLNERLYGIGELDRGGVERFDWSFDADTEDAVKDVQREANLPVTGVVNKATWRAIWDNREQGRHKRGSYIAPLAQANRVRKWKTTATGALLDLNPGYDPRSVKVDLTVEYPPGVRKSRARKWSRRVVDESRDPNWVGTLTLDGADMFVGDVDGDTVNPDPSSRLNLDAGQNIKVVGFDGDTVFHVSAIDVSSDKTVKAMIDTKARDAMTLDEIRRRNAENKRNPDRRRKPRRNRARRVEWTEGSGVLDHAKRLDGHRWNIVRIPAGDEGVISQLRLSVRDAKAEYAVAVFAEKVTRGALQKHFGNPLRDTGNDSYLDNRDAQDFMDRKTCVFVAGDYQQPGGYWPKRKTNKDGPTGAPITGDFRDDDNWRYETKGAPVLYLAVYPDRNCTLQAGRVMGRLKQRRD